MDIKEEISSFKSMINSYKLTNLTIVALVFHRIISKNEKGYYLDGFPSPATL